VFEVFSSITSLSGDVIATTTCLKTVGVRQIRLGFGRTLNHIQFTCVADDTLLKINILRIRCVFGQIPFWTKQCKTFKWVTTDDTAVICKRKLCSTVAIMAEM